MYKTVVLTKKKEAFFKFTSELGIEEHSVKFVAARGDYSIYNIKLPTFSTSNIKQKLSDAQTSFL